MDADFFTKIFTVGKRKRLVGVLALHKTVDEANESDRCGKHFC